MRCYKWQWLIRYPWLPFSLRKSFPPIMGIYFCVDDQKNVQYVGKTTNLKQRFACHHRIAEFEKLNIVKVYFRIIESENGSLLNDLESFHIREFNPPLNRSSGRRVKGEDNK